jgi:ATP:cob(I)alamin adenosyltransferase
MSVYTKKGDTGETSLYGGMRVAKDSLRVWCYGTVDEANSILGLIYSALAFDDLRQIVRRIQETLFVLGAELASDEKGLEKLSKRIGDEDILFLEGIIDKYAAESGAISGFSIPGETPVSSLFHVARTVVRRAERHAVETSRSDSLPPPALRYLNRLSDALYILAKMEVYHTFVKKVIEKIEVLGSGGGRSNTPLDGVLCDRLCRAAGEESAKIGLGISIAIADTGGRLVFFFRYPEASLVSVDVAQNKAYTAVAMEQPSGNIYKEAIPGGSLYGINTVDPRIVVFGGGFPLFFKGNLIGGIGISGGTVEQDEQIAHRVLAEFGSYMEEA